MTARPWPERPGHAPDEPLMAIRRQTEAAVAAGNWHVEPPPVEMDLGGVRALLFATAAPRGAILHFHGGGYRMGCPEMTASFASALGARCQADVICPDYRLAPEHPFPAALNDGWACWAELRARGAGPIILSGDSAGGGLAAGLAVQGLTHSLSANGVALLSPWIDLSVTSGCYDRNAGSDPVFSRASAMASAADYLQGFPADMPLACPLCGDLSGFPPTFISIGSGEVLADDALRFHDALTRADALSTLDSVDGMEHVAVTRGFDRPGARETFDRLAAFIDRCLALPAMH